MKDDDTRGDQVREHMLKLADGWRMAIVANDAAAIGQFMTDDWVIVSQTGISEKPHFLAFVESGDLTHEAMEMIGGTERLRIYRDTAVLTGRVTNTAHYKGQEFKADEWTTDVFIKTDGEWKCVLSHITAAEPAN